MNRQAVTAENARRIVGRIMAAANDLDANHALRFDVTTTWSHGSGSTLRGASSRLVLDFIEDEAQAATAAAADVQFRIQPLFPTFTVKRHTLSIARS